MLEAGAAALQSQLSLRAVNLMERLIHTYGKT
jgi:hypothetical protein